MGKEKLISVSGGPVYVRMFAMLQLFVAVTSSSTIAKSVNIIFFPHQNSCSGAAFTFSGALPGVCYRSNSNASPVSIFFDAGSCQSCSVFKGASICGASDRVAWGPGPICWTSLNFAFTGAAFHNTCRRLRRQLLGPGPEDEAQVVELGDSEIHGPGNPTGVVYTDDIREGFWVFKCDNAMQVMSEMENLPDEQKAAWLQAKGATLQPGPTGNMTTTVFEMAAAHP